MSEEQEQQEQEQQEQEQQEQEQHLALPQPQCTSNKHTNGVVEEEGGNDEVGMKVEMEVENENETENVKHRLNIINTNATAMLDMILTIVGEGYGQRDLLVGRGFWGDSD